MSVRAAMHNFLTTDIYGLTAQSYSLGRSNAEVVEQLIAAGIKVIQYREKDKPAGLMYQECQQLRRQTQTAGVTFVVNDHIDLAIAVGADGVHIGQDDLPPVVVRQLVGPDMIIGLSTQLPEHAQTAVSSGVVDYIGVGPVFATQTKQDVGQPVGWEYLEFVAQHIELPFVAIGGIKEHNIAQVCSHGARICAIITDIVGAADIPAKVSAIRQAIKSAGQS